MTPKEKAIKEAYGDKWDRVKDIVDMNNGSIDLVKCHPTELGYSYHEIEEFQRVFRPNRWRPIQLSGIEDNNGWIEGLPPDDASDIWVISRENKHLSDVNYQTLLIKSNKESLSKVITHWQPLVKPKPPIYDEQNNMQ
jgi:hypothetical protein